MTMPSFKVSDLCVSPLSESGEASSEIGAIMLLSC